MSDDKNQKPAAADSNQKETDLAPSAGGAARRTCLSYVNRDSLPGHMVQHWLKVEAELLGERNLARVHGFHHPK